MKKWYDRTKKRICGESVAKGKWFDLKSALGKMREEDDEILEED